MTTQLLTSAIRMTSKEIAELVEKRHTNVKRTIETLANKGLIAKPQIEFFDELNNLGLAMKRERYVFGVAQKRDTLIVVAQLCPEFTARIVDRWQELEQGQHAQHAPRITDPTLAALVQSLVELDQIKQRQYDAEQEQHALAQRVTKVELQHRSGVPEGYRSKKHAHHLYGVGLSEEVFHLAMAHLNVASKSYIHTGDGGYEVPSIAYKEDEIAPAVEAFLDDAFQCSPQMCESPLLKGRRFRFHKEDLAA